MVANNPTLNEADSESTSVKDSESLCTKLCSNIDISSSYITFFFIVLLKSENTMASLHTRFNYSSLVGLNFKIKYVC